MSASERTDRALHAYHDGEISRLARWRLERRLARSPALRRELRSLSQVTALVREVDREPPATDLWDAIEAQLPARPVVPAERVGRGASWWVRPLGAGLVATAAAALLVLGLWPRTPDVNRVVRWLDTGGKPVLVLQGDAETTIIWILEAAQEEEVRRPSRAV